MNPLAPNPAGPGETPQRAADRITRAAGSSFAFGMSLMARPRREAMHAVYAFCRTVDDIADGDPPADRLSAAERIALLTEWRAEIDRVYAGAPVSAIGQALAGPVTRYDLPKAEFVAMIDGMKTDARGPVVAPTMDELRLYVRQVAGTVGHLSMRIFGAWRGDVSARFATVLAEAIQFTNILRDVAEDAGRGRLYLPAEFLEDAGAPADPARIAGHPALPLASTALGREAWTQFAASADLVRAHDRVALAPALAMMGVYRRYLAVLEARGWQAAPPVRLGKWAKIAAGVGTIVAPRG